MIISYAGIAVLSPVLLLSLYLISQKELYHTGCIFLSVMTMTTVMMYFTLADVVSPKIIESANDFQVGPISVISWLSSRFLLYAPSSANSGRRHVANRMEDRSH